MGIEQIRTGNSGHWALQKPGLFTNVPRLSASELSYGAFMNITAARQPVILTGLATFRSWDWDYVTNACGDVSVTLRAPISSESSVSWAGLRVTSKEMRLSDWIAHVRRGQPAGNDD